MRKILLFLSLLAVISCESIEYDGETRLLIEGQIIDGNSDPMRDISVKIEVYNSSTNASDVISYGTSDATGSFKLVIPAPKSEDNFIRVEMAKPGNPYDLKIIDSISKADFSNYKLNLGRIDFYDQSNRIQTIYTSQN